MTFSDYLPPAIYAFIFNLARDNELSVKEVQVMLLREQIGLLGFTCDHTKIGYPKNKSQKQRVKPFCKQCWTRMEEIKPAIYDYQQKLVKEGEYGPIETFLDRKRKEDASQIRSKRKESTQMKEQETKSHSSRHLV